LSFPDVFPQPRKASLPDSSSGGGFGFTFPEQAAAPQSTSDQFTFSFGDAGAAGGGFGFAFPTGGAPADTGFTFTFSPDGFAGAPDMQLPPEKPDETYERLRELMHNSVFDPPNVDLRQLFDRPDADDGPEAALAFLLKR
jgi:flavin-dependent dehydrogenase